MKAALQKFQTKNRLSSNGEMTAKTWEKLIIKVEKGSKGSAVRAVQLQLRQIGYDIGVDGIFGQQTERVVKEYQKEKGIKVDGIVGRYTWNRLTLDSALYYEDC